MALSIDFQDSVSFLPTIQATRLLTLASAGLTPAEYTSLSWTYGSGYWFPPPWYRCAACARERFCARRRWPPSADESERRPPALRPTLGAPASFDPAPCRRPRASIGGTTNCLLPRAPHS